MPLQVDFRRRVLKGGATGAGLPAFDTHPSPSAQLRNKGVWCVQVDASAEHRRTGTQHGRERRPLTTNAAAERPAERRRLCAKRPEARASTSLLRAFRHRPLRLQPSLSPPPSRHGTLSLRSVQQRSSGPKGGADAKTQAPSTTRLRVIRPPVLFFYVAEAHARKSSGRPTLTHTPQRSPLRVACRRPSFLVIQVRSSDYDTVRPRGFLPRRMTEHEAVGDVSRETGLSC